MVMKLRGSTDRQDIFDAIIEEGEMFGTPLSIKVNAFYATNRVMLNRFVDFCQSLTNYYMGELGIGCQTMQNRAYSSTLGATALMDTVNVMSLMASQTGTKLDGTAVNSPQFLIEFYKPVFAKYVITGHPYDTAQAYNDKVSIATFTDSGSESAEPAMDA